MAQRMKRLGVRPHAYRDGPSCGVVGGKMKVVGCSFAAFLVKPAIIAAMALADSTTGAFLFLS